MLMDIDIEEKLSEIDDYKLYYAIQQENIKDIRYLLRTRKFDYTYYPEVYAVKTGNIEIVKLFASVVPLPIFILETACISGNCELVKYLYNRKFPITSMCSIEAARHGHLNIIKWLFFKPPKINYFTLKAAAENSHFNIIKWLVLYGIKLDVSVMKTVARKGDLLILKWLLLHHCPFNADVCSEAIHYDKRNIVFWWLSEKLPIDDYTISLLNKNIFYIKYILFDNIDNNYPEQLSHIKYLLSSKLAESTVNFCV